MHIPHFTCDQLIDIYEAANRSVDVDILQSTARALYPEIIGPDHKPPIFVREGSYKGFFFEGDYRKAKYSIVSRLVNGIGIMDDGTPISYDK